MPSHRSPSEVLAGEQQPHSEVTHFSRDFPILPLVCFLFLFANASSICPILFLSRCANHPLLSSSSVIKQRGQSMSQMKDIDSCTINTVRKYQQTKTSWLLFYLLLEKGKKDDRENKFLYMDVLHNYFSSLQSGYKKNLQYHPASLTHYVAVQTRINSLPGD